MIEEQLLNYGVLGLWTISLLYRQLVRDKQLNRIVDNNTRAMVRVYEVMNKCKK